MLERDAGRGGMRSFILSNCLASEKPLILWEGENPVKTEKENLIEAGTLNLISNTSEISTLWLEINEFEHVTNMSAGCLCPHSGLQLEGVHLESILSAATHTHSPL